MKIITESEALKNVSILDDAWNSIETFAFIPDKSGVEVSWIENALDLFPLGLKEDHFCLLTSGSTGKPKLIVVEKKRSESLVKVIHEKQKNDSAKNTILVLPLNYSYAFINQWLWARVMKRDFIISPGFKDPAQMANILSKNDETMICLVGAQIPLLKKHLPGYKFRGVVRVNFAGGPYPHNEIGYINQTFPNAKVFNNYGCAEAMPRLTIRSHVESEDPSNVGKPLPGIEIKSDEDGALIFRSSYQLSAYYSDSGLVQVPDKSWIPSGDFGEILDSGYVKIKGRSNEVYKRYGEKIALPNLIRVVKTIWDGQAIFYREKDNNGEEGHVLVCCPEPNEKQLKEILKVFRAQYTRIHWPLRIEGVNEIPLLGNDKIDVSGLKADEKKKLLWRQRT